MRIKRYNESKSGAPMKAKIVTMSLMTRVVGPAWWTDEQFEEKARSQFHEKLDTEYWDNLEEIYDDSEVPFDPKTEADRKEQEKYYDEWKKSTQKKFDL